MPNIINNKVNYITLVYTLEKLGLQPMKNLITLILIVVSFSCFAQWIPFNVNQHSYFKHFQPYSSPSDTIITEFLFDSINQIPTHQTYYNNYKDADFNNCYKEANQAFSFSFFERQYIKPDSILVKNDTIFVRYESDSILFLPQLNVGQSWISPIKNASAFNQLQFTCTSIQYGNFFNGLNDSLKTFAIQTLQNNSPVSSTFNGLTIILSKNYGFKQFITFNVTNPTELTLIGFENNGVNYDFSFPTFSDYFHLAVGDVVIWKEESPLSIYGPASLVYHKDSIVSSLISPDSVVYQIQRNSSNGNVSSFAAKYLKNNMKALLSSSFVYVKSTILSPINYIVIELDSNDLLETLETYLSNDTVVNRKFRNYGYRIDTSTCQTSSVTDQGSTVEYNTYYGLFSYESSTFIKITFTIVGSTISGVQEGSLWNNLITSVDELNLKNATKIYPNPSVDGIIYVENINNTKLNVFSIDGKLMLSRQINSINKPLSIHLPKGSYFFQFISNNGVISVEKIVVVGN